MIDEKRDENIKYKQPKKVDTLIKELGITKIKDKSEKQHRIKSSVKKLLFIIALLIAIIILTQLTINFNNWVVVKKVTIILLLFIVVKLLISIVEDFLYERYGDKEEVEHVFVFKSVFSVILWTLFVLISVSLVLNSWKQLITSVGIIGAGLAVALHQPIINLVGWVTLISGYYYSIGDRVEIDGIKGDVFDISLMYTKLRRVTESDEVTGSFVSIPNQYILTKPIINYSKPTSFVWDTIIFSITYESDLQTAITIIQDSSKQVLSRAYQLMPIRKGLKTRLVKKEPEAIIRVKLAESSINLKLRYLVDIKMKNKIKTDIIKGVVKVIKSTENVSFAYPHIQILH